MKKLWSSIRYKIGALMLLISIGPLIILGWIILSTLFTQLQDFSTRLSGAENALRSDVVGRNLTGAASDTVNDIDEYLLERIADVRRWSEAPIVVEAARQGTLAAHQAGLVGITPEAIQEELAGLLFVPITQTVFSPALSYVFQQTERAETPFIEIIVTEASGVNVLITRPVDRVAHGDMDWWQTARAQGVGGIGITKVHIDAASNAPALGLALPIVDPDTKETLGVIRALIRLTSLQLRLSRKAASTATDIRVFTADGQLIADTASNHDVRRILNDTSNVVAQAYVPATQALQATSGAEGAGFTLVEADGDIVGYARTNGGEFYNAPAQLSNFEGFGWGVTIAQPELTALQVLSELIATGQAFERLPQFLGSLFGVALVLVAVVSVIGAVVLSGSISKPLVELSEMAQEVQQGNLDAQVPVRTRDEVGLLENAFNLMTIGLKERERERDVFGRVVTPEVREKLLEGELELGGETLWVTALFSDIRGFSTKSEKMTPQEVVAFLNEYLTEMTEAIQPWGGYLNNFIGDAVVVVFGAPVDLPDKEWRAVCAAQEMRRRLIGFNQRRIERGEIPIDIGVGISTGVAVAGQIGSMERLMYTVIGDSVNVAARLEALTRDYPDYPILINGATAEAIKGREGIELKSLGLIKVKGRTEPVDVYGVVEHSAE